MIYTSLLLIHIIAAIVGLGPSFAMGAMLKASKTKHKILWTMELFKKIEKFSKIGNITLLLTGIAMALVNSSLWKEGWFITSILIYVAVQFITIGKIPKSHQEQERMLRETQDEELPPPYIASVQNLKPYNAIVHSAAIVLIVLMVLKPF
ncbi:DUF2269 family protein [Salimicrobium halophilum]|uniref:Predicted integral membrane protein n=1 Tax=Salimicrobium halophilum TaxID=86666 RepID=A0A1G8QY36_9BACI|nr:DUF2269 family protein [Salimicrobium halophilum]SDJ09618.1 Predicted integral membrane protein [Salimicrobium halophilum]